MRALRYLYILALSIWLGGMAIAGFAAAPATFSVLEGWNPSLGRVLAGRVFGEVLRRLYIAGYAAGLLMLLALVVQRVLGPKPRSNGIRAGIVVIMLAVTAYSGFTILPRVDQIQREVNGSISDLPAEHPARAEFERLHSLSTTLMTVSIVGGLVLLGWETRE
jgi:Domain of unknown function (DUF4149)